MAVTMSVISFFALTLKALFLTCVHTTSSMAARIPMMVMTVRISTRVKPDAFRLCIFIGCSTNRDIGIDDGQTHIRKFPVPPAKTAKL